MGQRSRKRRGADAPVAAPPADGAETMRRGYARGEARNEAVRADLEPLGPGERPRAIVVASAVAVLIAVANVVLLLAGWEVRGSEPKPAQVVLFSAIMLAAAVGMWQRRYWAVLGFQALLGISIVFSALSLLVASNVQGVLLSVTVIALSGTLFWFLVRVMARLQMPERGRAAQP